MTPRHAWLDTPLGALRLTAEGDAITRVTLGAAPDAVLDTVLGAADARPAHLARDDEASGVLAEARAQLAEYFAGARTTFDLPLAPAGTAFQRRTWDALAAVPFGATTTYAAIARTLGDVRAVRAVGAANGRNPLAIVVPCHRVVGTDGSLTGYAGGLDRKRWLLRHEAAVGERAAGGFALALG